MRALALLVMLVVALLVCPDPTFAASDDDIPGIALDPGMVIDSLDAGSDASDVYRVALESGEELRVVFRTQTGGSAKGKFRMLVPATPSVTQVDAALTAYLIAGYNVSAGPLLFSLADFTHVAARAGTYYLWVLCTEGTLSYELRTEGTGRPFLAEPDADDIPGVPLGLGSASGVVDTLTDHDDLYDVKLFADRPVEFRLLPAAADDRWGAAHLSLLTPDSTSVASVDTYRNAVEQDPAHTAYNRSEEDQAGSLTFTPTETGVYHLRVKASSVISNFPYTLQVSGSAAPPGGDTPSSGAAFPDVGTDHPYRVAIEGIHALGIAAGYETGLFGPGDGVKRAQFAKMIVSTVGLAPSEGMYHPFTDLGENPATDLYPHEFVAAAYAYGITQGTTASTFGPYLSVSRAQAVTMIVRAVQRLRGDAFGQPPSGYGTLGDFDATHSANMRAAEFNGLLAGLQDFGPVWDPWATATRGECAQILWNVTQF
jgi:hypothetical protein